MDGASNMRNGNCYYTLKMFICNCKNCLEPITLTHFFVGLWSQSADKLTIIQYHVAVFYKPTIPQSPPSHLRDYSTCNNARLEFSTIFVPSFDPNEW
jgi:hypothetical protein